MVISPKKEEKRNNFGNKYYIVGNEKTGTEETQKKPKDPIPISSLSLTCFRKSCCKKYNQRYVKLLRYRLLLCVPRHFSGILSILGFCVSLHSFLFCWFCVCFTVLSFVKRCLR